MRLCRRSCMSTTSIPTRSRKLAKAAGHPQLRLNPVDAGPRHEEAKSLTEEEVTGAIIRTLKGGDAHGLCSLRQRRAWSR